MATESGIELWRLSATDLVAGYRAGLFEPVAVTESVLERVARCNTDLNAIVSLDQEGARAAARASRERYRSNQSFGPLDGVPMTVKDNITVAGLRCTWGSRLFAEQVCMRDELPIACLRAGGAVILGKTNTPEFAMVGHTDNLVFGPTRNPWDRALTVGGSSGGAVAAVAAGMAPIAIGTDGGGSIRRPASHTGLVGFKPSRGRVPRADGLPAIFLDYEVIGPIARTVDDVISVMQIIGTADPRDAASSGFADRPFCVPQQLPKLRILHVPRFGDAPVDPEISSSVSEAAEVFRALGHQVDVSTHFDLADSINARWMQLSQAGLAHMLMQHGDWRKQLTPAAITNAETGAALAGTELFELLQMVASMSNRLSETFSRYDVLLTPAAAALPWPIERSYPEHIDGQIVGPRGHAVFTGFVNAAGLPAIALPCTPGASGMPNGLQLVGRWAEDGILCALARQYELKQGWHSQWPPI